MRISRTCLQWFQVHPSSHKEARDAIESSRGTGMHHGDLAASSPGGFEGLGFLRESLA
jgi:hypothetical protein